MKYINLISLLFVVIVSFASCKKDKIEQEKVIAKILFESDLSVDGCGYFLLIQENKYKPIELTNEYKKDGLIQ